MRRLLLVLLLFTSCGHGIEYSNGARVGYVLKFSNKGLLCKTWEGQMNLAGNGQTSLVTFDFTVDSDRAELIAFLQLALENGKRVKVIYQEGQLTGLCTTESGYFIQSAIFTEEKAQ